MPEAQKAKAPEQPATKKRASETEDPAVHQVLAEIQTAQSNGDDKAVASLTQKLSDLGYE